MSVPAILKRTIKSRDELKAYFKNGRVPDEKNFADLIDSLVHPSDLPPPPELPEIPTLPVVPLPEIPTLPVEPNPPPALERIPAGMHIGRFDPVSKNAFRLLPPDALQASCRAPADGAWHPVLKGLNDCYAFEIVACASGLLGSPCQAVTHAIALTSFRTNASVRQTFSGTAPPSGWRWWPRRRRYAVQFQWRQGFDSTSLYVRSTGNFGLDEEGREVMIDYHVTRLW